MVLLKIKNADQKLIATEKPMTTGDKATNSGFSSGDRLIAGEVKCPHTY